MPSIIIDLIDISNTALENIRRNIKRFKCQKSVKSYKLDILNQIPTYKYDVLVSNPPYIEDTMINKLDYSVKYYDPINALTDYSDGLTFYRRIHQIADQVLNKNGIIIMEAGNYQQINEIKNIFDNYITTIHNDLNNDPRIIELKRQSQS